MSASTKALHVHATGPNAGKLLDATAFYTANPPGAVAGLVWMNHKIIPALTGVTSDTTYAIGRVPFDGKLHRLSVSNYAIGSQGGNYELRVDSSAIATLDSSEVAVSAATGIWTPGSSEEPVLTAGDLLFIKSPSYIAGTTGLDVTLEIEPT